MMQVKKKEILFSIYAIVACLLPAGCKKDEPVDHSIQGYTYANQGNTTWLSQNLPRP